MKRLIILLCVVSLFSGFNVSQYQTNCMKGRGKGSSYWSSPANLQEGVSGYSGCEDTELSESASTSNYGTDVLRIRANASGYSHVSLIRFDLSSVIPPGSTISSVSLTLTLSAVGDAGVNYVYTCLRSWVESEATWNAYSTGNSWTTAGCKSDTNDLSGTAGSSTGSLSSFTVNDSDPADTTTYTASTSSAFVTAAQNALDGDGILNLVIHQRTGDNGNNYFHQSEAVTDNYKPKLTIAWS